MPVFEGFKAQKEIQKKTWVQWVPHSSVWCLKIESIIHMFVLPLFLQDFPFDNYLVIIWVAQSLGDGFRSIAVIGAPENESGTTVKARDGSSTWAHWSNWYQWINLIIWNLSIERLLPWGPLDFTFFHPTKSQNRWKMGETRSKIKLPIEINYILKQHKIGAHRP